MFKGKLSVMIAVFGLFFSMLSISAFAAVPSRWGGSVTINSVPVNGTMVIPYEEGNINPVSNYLNPPYGSKPPFGYYIIDINESVTNVFFKVNNMPSDQSPSPAEGKIVNLNLTVTDADNDTYSIGYPGYTGADKDCNDANPSINPGRTEVLGNGKDDDCNASTYDNFNGIPADIGGNIESLSMTIDGSSDLPEFLTGEHTVKFNDGGETLLEFKFDFTGSYIDFSALTIKKNESAGVGSIVIGGLDLGENNNKTVYVKNLNNLTTLCIKDADIASVSQISSLCNGANEFALDCPGINGNYNCTFTDNSNSTFKVSGLRHSGIQQQTYCGDGTCNSGESCSSCPSDCGSCPPSGGGTPTGGGGGCIYNWTCMDWSACQPAGTQTRTCTNYGSCGAGYNPPATTQSCTYTTPIIPASTPTPAPQPTPTPAPSPTPPTGEAAQPTTPAITGLITAGDATLYGGIIVVVVIIAAAAYLKFFRKKK